MPRELGVFYNNVRAGNYTVAVNGFSNYADDPDIQLNAFPEQIDLGRYKDPVLEDLYRRQSQATDKAQRRQIVKQFEVRALDEQAWALATHWWNRIVLHSPKVKGVKLLPSHYLNQDLSNLWLEKE